MRAWALACILILVASPAYAAGGVPTTPVLGIHYALVGFLGAVAEALWLRQRMSASSVVAAVLAADLIASLAVLASYFIVSSWLGETAPLWNRGDLSAIYWFDGPALLFSVLACVGLESAALAWELGADARRASTLRRLVCANLWKHAAVVSAFGAIALLGRE